MTLGPIRTAVATLLWALAHPVAATRRAATTLEYHATWLLCGLEAWTKHFEEKLWGEYRAGSVLARKRRLGQRGQLGVFMVLVMGAIALVTVSIILLFGIDIAGEFAEPLTQDPQNTTYGEAANSTATSSGDAFELFGTSVLVIPAAAVLAVLIGGLVGAISMGGSLPGMGGNSRDRRR